MADLNTKDTIREKKQNPQLSTQRYMQFAGAREGVLILKNGGLRSILEVSSINFNLKSETEQQSIITGYQRFLNALNFPVQIQIRSRKLDIDHYLEDLKVRRRKIENNLLQHQMGEYIEYVQKLVEYSDIMEKRFFVVIPIDPPRAQKKGLFASFMAYIQNSESVLDVLQRRREFKDLKKELETRVNIVKTALENCSLSTRQLDTEEIIELFYQAYNPQRSRLQKFSHSEDLSAVSGGGEYIDDQEKSDDE